MSARVCVCVRVCVCERICATSSMLVCVRVCAREYVRVGERERERERESGSSHLAVIIPRDAPSKRAHRIPEDSRFVCQ